MNITVNNKTVDLPDHFTIENLLRKMSFPDHVSVWMNGKQVLMGEYSIITLKQSDRVSIIRPLAGG